MTNILHASHQDDTISDVTENIDTLLTNARPRLLRLAHAQGVPPDAAEDIIQETLLEAWRHLNALRNPARFDAWLNGICRNVCLRWQRSQNIATTRHRRDKRYAAHHFRARSNTTSPRYFPGITNRHSPAVRSQH